MTEVTLSKPLLPMCSNILNQVVKREEAPSLNDEKFTSCRGRLHSAVHAIVYIAGAIFFPVTVVIYRLRRDSSDWTHKKWEILDIALSVLLIPLAMIALAIKHCIGILVPGFVFCAPAPSAK